MGEGSEADADAHDLENDAFWRQMYAILQQTGEMTAELAKEQGVDLESIDAKSIAEEERRRHENARKSELYQAAEKYADMVGQWFAGEIGAKETGAGVGQEGVTAYVPDEVVKDATEVIHWYRFQIAVKIMRGLMGRSDEDGGEEDGSQTDSDGSVKVALIGMDRSLIAWRKMLDHRPEKKESILPILFHLERLRRQAGQHFPHARGFIRPGFDTLHGRLIS